MGNDFLPKRHRFSHEFCYFLHDQMVEAIISGEKAQIFHHQKKMSSAELAEIDGLFGEELIKWFENNGHVDLVIWAYYKQASVALLSDMLLFIYEALQCSKKGKLTVAYALLRKPLKENLFYLEWLLGRPDDFLLKFYMESPRALSINSGKSKEEKLEIIERALECTGNKAGLSAELLYEMRYEKSSQESFEPLFQKANHLVTTFRFLETENQNFNFIFSGFDSLESQWEFLYDSLPLILYHAVEVVEALLSNFAERKLQFDLMPIRTDIGFLFWLKKGPFEFDLRSFRKDIKAALKGKNILCQYCGILLTYNERDLLHIYQDYSVTCKACSRKNDFWSRH